MIDTKLNNNLSFYEEKALFFQKNSSFRKRKKWIKKHYPRFAVRAFCKRLAKPNLPLWINFSRWVLIDYLMGKIRRFWGIYQFVALPGEGKTISMVMHMEKARKEFPNVYIATNFHYKHQDFQIDDWLDIVTVALDCYKKDIPCIVAVDEIHITFDASDWRSFPPEMLAVLSFNRKFNLQFLCSSQIYERIPSKIRAIANYTVICKNIFGMDRMFRNYYFCKDDYEANFSGQRKKAEFIREFVASDDVYDLYNTREQVQSMKNSLEKERNKKEDAFRLLFGSEEKEDAEKTA